MLPVKIFNDSVLSYKVKITGNNYNIIVPLSLSDDYYEGRFTVSQEGLYSVSLSVSLLSGVVLSDSAKSYVSITSSSRQIQAEINSGCFKPTLMVYWISESKISTDKLYNLDLDTNIIKRVSIKNIDSIADTFYNEGLFWYRSMPVHYYILDSNMIPLVKYSTGFFRNTVTTSQTAFAFYEQYQHTLDSVDRQGFINNANWLATNNHSGYYFYEFDFRHTSSAVLKKNWVSAMAQGEALGALSLAYYFLEDSTYLKEADSVFNTFHHNSNDFWSFLPDDKGYYWLEEYPNNAFCHVLNGKMAALWGVFQYYTITRNKMALRVLEAGLKTAIDHYKIWNVSNSDNSYYCLHGEIKPHYHAVHKNQFLTFAERFNILGLYDAYHCLANDEVIITPQSICFNYQADTIEVQIDSPLDWEAVDTSDWLSTQRTGGNLLVMVDTNFSSLARNSVVEIRLANGGLFHIDVAQDPIHYFFNVDEDTLLFQYQADTFELLTNSNIDWEAVDTAYWLNTQRIGDNLLVMVDTNFSNLIRNTSIVIRLANGELFQIDVVQKPINYFLEVDEDTLSFGCKLDTLSIKVLSNYPKISVSVLCEWLKYYWKNDSVLSVIADKNSEVIKRESTILISTTDLQKEIWITQEEGGILSLDTKTINFKVYPNPADDKFLIEFMDLQLFVYFELYSIKGELLMQKSIDQNYATIDISFLLPGDYLILIKNVKNEIIKTQRLIKR